jgi:hypothetical protein
MSTLAEILANAKTLASGEQYDLAMSLLAGLKSFVGGSVTGKKARKTKDPNAPKREVPKDSYIHFVNKTVWPILQRIAEAIEDAEEKKLIRGVSARTQISKTLWDSLKDLESEEKSKAIEELSEKRVQSVYDAWKLLPHEKKPRKSKNSDSESSASEGSKASKSSKKPAKEPLSDEEKKEKRKAAAAKAAATKAAKKAEAKAAPPAEAAPAEEEVVEVKPVDWIHAFKGQKKKVYERVDFEGKAYIYDSESKEYLGVFVEKTDSLDKSIADPFAESE